MAELAVVNSSPLIFLAKAGLIDLLHLLSPQVMIPDPVAQSATTIDRALALVGE